MTAELYDSSAGAETTSTSSDSDSPTSLSSPEGLVEAYHFSPKGEAIGLTYIISAFERKMERKPKIAWFHPSQAKCPLAKGLDKYGVAVFACLKTPLNNLWLV